MLQNIILPFPVCFSTTLIFKDLFLPMYATSDQYWTTWLTDFSLRYSVMCLACFMTGIAKGKSLNLSVCCDIDLTDPLPPTVR